MAFFWHQPENSLQKTIMGMEKAMAMVENQNPSVDELEQKYNDITVLYDYAEELLATVESDFVADPEQQLELLEPLVNDIGDATDVLTEEFINLAEACKHGIPGSTRRNRVEGAIRKMYIAINQYREKAGAGSKKARQALANIADPIVNKIQRQVEKIVVVFLEFVQLSLDRIMNKVEYDLLKMREAKVALMMHQWAQQQHQGS